MTIDKAFESWGSFDIDDPFPLFAQVRDLGAVHRVTSARAIRCLAMRFPESAGMGGLTSLKAQDGRLHHPKRLI